MSEAYTVAKFWKCALQVNPYDYIGYRGKSHGLTEKEYNQKLLEICKEQDIKIIGIADHGNVKAIDPIRTLLNRNDVLVFPGFEIATTEKAHFVCLFPESTPTEQLTRYLGNLDLTDPDECVRPSKLSAEELIRRVDKLEGFTYAAHATLDSGLLKQKLNHIWRLPLLRAAQIPGKVDDLPQNFLNIIRNMESEYIRTHPIGIINSKDVAVPEDLKDPSASCLIKMTTPSFQAFKMAFLDSESRVRLNYDVRERYYSTINSISISGGFLDGLSIELSEHLNTVIGGRGTGKSTLLECIRYALDKAPVGKEARRKHEDIIKTNLGLEKGRIELKIRSSAKTGRTFILSRRYGEPVIVKDGDGAVSRFSSGDILPHVELYGQNEILEIADNQELLFESLQRFLPDDFRKSTQDLALIEKKLTDNADKLMKAMENTADIQDKIATLPKLQEEEKQYPKTGLEKLKIIPYLERERGLLSRAAEEYERVSDSLESLKEGIPDISFLGDSVLSDLPHKEQLKSIRKHITSYISLLSEQVDAFDKAYHESFSGFTTLQKACGKDIESNEAEIEKSFKKLPSLEGKSGKEIGIAYQNLLKRIEQIRPFEARLKSQIKALEVIQKERENLLAELSDLRSQRSAQLTRSVKSLNKKLSGKLRVTIIPEGETAPIKRFLLDCGLEGIGEKRLSWIDSAQGLTPISLVKTIREGKESLKSQPWEVTPSVAEALGKLDFSDLLKLEALSLPDRVSIELNVSHAAEAYRPIGNLSTGQKCTAILHLLLLENSDPLIMDQPEDNLDNAFIAERIVTELRASKMQRQFIFATHNANIPVFGDAEWIGILESSSEDATLPPERQGSIDSPFVRDKAAEILEGGKAAFMQRKDKYGYE
ncbi:MAG: DNA repair protein [Spirochaetes bacterium]|nr:MAG: DNA repair protein [Spirochaetota bacterium]